MPHSDPIPAPWLSRSHAEAREEAVYAALAQCGLSGELLDRAAKCMDLLIAGMERSVAHDARAAERESHECEQAGKSAARAPENLTSGEIRMKIEIKEAGRNWTNSPRDMTADEIVQVRHIGRLEAVKLHRAWTGSTLDAAIRAVDAARATT